MSIDNANHPVTTDEYSGGCPVCGKSDGYRNIGCDHWGSCAAHRTRWYIGSNLFSCWKEEDQAAWDRNAKVLGDFEEVKPVRTLTEGSEQRVTPSESPSAEVATTTAPPPTHFTMPADIRLEGAAGTYLFLQSTWEMLLHNAWQYGWEPQHRRSLYVADIGLEVTAEDATALADAVQQWMDATIAEGGLDGSLMSDNLDKWEAAVAFFRAGGFQILSCGVDRPDGGRSA